MASPLCGDADHWTPSGPGNRLSCHCHRTALTPIYKLGTARGGKWRVVSWLQQQCAVVWVCVMCCVGHITVLLFRHLLDTVALTAADWPTDSCPMTVRYQEPVDGSQHWMRRGREWEQQMNVSEYLTPDYSVIKAEPASSTPPGDRSFISHWCHTDSTVAYSRSLTCAIGYRYQSSAVSLSLLRCLLCQ